MKLLKNAFLAFIFSNLVFAQQENPKFDEVRKTAVTEKALVLIKENYVFLEKFDSIEKEIKNELINKEYNKFDNP